MYMLLYFSGNIRRVGCTAGGSRPDVWVSWRRQDWTQSSGKIDNYFRHFTGRWMPPSLLVINK